MKWLTILLSVLFLIISLMHFFIGLDPVFFKTVVLIRASIYLQEIFIALILSTGGLVLQTLLQNPLAEPYVLGISSGSTLGAVLAVFLSLSPLLLYRTFFAIIGALLLSTAILLVSRKKSGFSIETAVLLGVACNALFSSIIFLLQSFLMPNDLQASIRWLMGNIDYISFYEIALLFIAACLNIFYLFYYHKQLDIYITGDEMAQAVGVDTEKLKIAGFLMVSLSAGIAVSIVGMIGFLGLIAPHIVKMIYKMDHRRLLYPLFLISSILIILSGILSKNIIQGSIIPIGIITSLIGVPFFIFILLKRYKKQNY
jgi:iron complex transport system permease protein